MHKSLKKISDSIRKFRKIIIIILLINKMLIIWLSCLLCTQVDIILVCAGAGVVLMEWSHHHHHCPPPSDLSSSSSHSPVVCQPTPPSSSSTSCCSCCQPPVTSQASYMPTCHQPALILNYSLQLPLSLQSVFPNCVTAPVQSNWGFYEFLSALQSVSITVRIQKNWKSKNGPNTLQ